MAKSSEEARRTVQKCYLNLLELLPINRLVERLYSRRLLSLDRKSELDSLTSLREKIRHFLDAILIPGLNVDYTGHFDEMVVMMKESDDVLVKCLVEKLVPDVSATPSAELVNYDHFENLNFASYRSVTDAFTLLISIFEEKLPATKFEAIRLNCLHRAYRNLHNEISRTANIHDLLKLLLSYPIYLNWMKIDYLQTMAIAARSQVLQDTLQGYSDAVLSKTLGEVWNFIPSFHKTKTKFYFKVKAKFRGKNPNHIKIKDLIKYEPLFAKRIALHIMQIESGSLTITWYILAEEAYQAYLLSLIKPQEFRDDDFLQIGPWVVYHPQSVLQELKKCHVMKEDTTLLIGYYYDLLLRDINANQLTDKMSSAGLLTDTDGTVISSGQSVHQRNCLLLEHVRHMDVQALVTFCEFLKETCPQIGLQLITALKFESSSVSSQLPVDTSETKENNVESDRISSSVYILFLYLIDQVAKLLESYKPELIQQCNNLKASDIHNINLFSADKMEELRVSNDPFILLVMLSPLFSWSNHSILKALVSCSDEASKLLDKFESKLDPLEPITSYPIPCLSSNMIPSDTSTYTILAVRCKVELYESSLQYIYDVQSVMIEKCDITQHCLQLLAVRSDPTILYWTIPKCVVDLINTNVPLHSEYLYSRGILEVLVYPDLLLTTGDDICYRALAFKCENQLFSQEIIDLAITHQRKEIEVENLWRNEMENENVKFHKQMADQIKKLSSMIDQLKEDNRELNKYIEKHLETIPTPSKCKVHIPPVIIKDDETILEIMLRDKNDDPLSKINLMVKINSSGEDLSNEIRELNSGMYEVSFKPKQCGDHMISILVNGDHILNSPYKKSVAFRDYSKLTEDHYYDKEVQYYEMNKFNRFRDMATGPDGEIALLVGDQSSDDSQSSKAIIVILDKNLNPISVIGDEKSDSQFVNPDGVAISRNKIIAVSDKDQVKKFSIEGRFLSNLDGKENYQLMGLAFNDNDALYVADWQNYKIRVACNADDNKFTFSFGSEGVGQFQRPVKITIDPNNNNVFVCDDIGDGIYVFDEAGHFLSKINCDNLKDIAVDPAGYLITGHIGSRNSIRFWNHSYQCISQKHFKEKVNQQFESINAVAISLTGTLHVVESWKDPNKDILKEILTC